MKKLFILLIGGMLLVACQSSSTLNPIGSPTPLGCDTPGTIEMMNLEETSRGYPYRYGLYLPPCMGCICHLVTIPNLIACTLS